MMYTIGEFGRMGQVSRRQLRHWDEIGLLRPQKVDPVSGYRLYSASQLTSLNRIVALKELGLSLEQIGRFIEDDVSIDEMQGMLLLRKAEIEQQVLVELQRIRNIESRLKQIREHGERVEDVVVKEVPAAKFISIRSIVPDWASTYKVWNMAAPLLADSAGRIYGDLIGILHASGITTDYFDMEVGRILYTESHTPLITSEGQSFAIRELPGTLVASCVQKGPPYEAHIAFSAIGEWAEMNDYAFAGPLRGIIREPYSFDEFSDLIVEVQFPIEKRPADLTLLQQN
ncbi:MAG: MerR family transcriptional regulator [Chloroflexota bacterium]